MCVHVLIFVRVGWSASECISDSDLIELEAFYDLIMIDTINKQVRLDKRLQIN